MGRKQNNVANPNEKQAMAVLRKLNRKVQGILDVLRDMAYNRELPEPKLAGEYLALLMEEADFSLLGTVNIKVVKVGRSHQPDLRNDTLDADATQELSDAMRYSADLWAAVAQIKALGIKPIYRRPTAD